MTTEEFIKSLKAAKEAFDNKQKTDKTNDFVSNSISGSSPNTGDSEIVEIIKNRVTDEDVMRWIKEHIQPSYNGVYLHRTKARFFDKGDFSLKVFFSIDKIPQTGDNDPAVVFTYEKLDDTLKDILSEKETVLIKLNNK
jgi:hypothetical protein